MGETTFEVKRSTMKEDMIRNFCTMLFIPLMPCLLSDNDTCHNIVAQWFYDS